MDADGLKLISEEVQYETLEDGSQSKVIVKIYEKCYKTMECHRRASSTYQKKHREEINQKSAERRKEKYNTDTEYRELMKQKRRECYQKQKENK